MLHESCGDITVSKLIRIIMGDNQHAINIVAGDSRPHYTGEGFGFYTRGGTYIQHPSSYSKSGWSNMVYHSSTLTIEVGEDWCKKLIKDRVRHHEAQGITSYIRCGSRKIIHGISASQGWTRWKIIILVEDNTGRVYHSNFTNYKTAIKSAIRAWTEHSRNIKRFIAGLNVDLNEVEVIKEDSYAAGNCRVGTDAFISANKLKNKESILASDLLKIASDNRIKATISAAVERINRAA